MNDLSICAGILIAGIALVSLSTLVLVRSAWPTQPEPDSHRIRDEREGWGL